MSASDVEYARGRSKLEKTNAEIEHLDLRLRRRFIAFKKKAVVNMVAPEGAVDERE